uniref:Hexosyltransferase n=1 Tax=Clastoptera arizonana TaxID=38151 RepID=A0A1B6CHV2_9HEMI
MNKFMQILGICILLVVFLSYITPYINNYFYSSYSSFGIKIINPQISYLKIEKVLINLPFKFIIENNCSFKDSEIKLIQIVTSYAGNVEARSALRRAYPTNDLKKLGIYRIFLLSVLKSSDITQNALINENERFNDIIQGDFIESYKNLTYKHLMGLNWVVNYCKNINYIIKMDDDIIVDLYKLLRLIQETKNFQMLGYIFNNMRPIRIKANKWYVSTKEYDKNTYPSFLSGWLYVVNVKTAQTLIELSLKTPFFWIDDVYVTGILTDKANIKFEDMSKYFTTNPEYLECCIRDKIDCDIIVGPSGGDNNLQIFFQKHAFKCFNSICDRYINGKFLNNSCITQRKTTPLHKGFPNLHIIKL